MKPKATILSGSFPEATETLAIRMAVPADAPALTRLVQLDSAPPPKPVPMLVAEVAGELRAALPLDGGPAIADPFERTAEFVAMLAARARQLETPPRRPAGRRRRRLGGEGPAPAFHG